MRSVKASVITFVISLLGSPFFGRSMWCDEMLRYKAQKDFTLFELWKGKALSAFDSQTPFAYTIYRPFQELFGFDFGAALVSAFASSVIVILAARTYKRIVGRDADYVSLVAGALCPSLLYFGSELWFYAPFGAAVAWLSYEASEYAIGYRRFRIGLVLSSLVVVGFHFSGAFVSLFLIGFSALVVFARRGFRCVVSMCLHVVPCLTLVPMYVVANRSALHMDSVGTIRWEQLHTVVWWVWQYAANNIPFYFYGIFGMSIVAYGVYRMIVLDAKRSAFVLMSLVSVVPYLVYSHLRGYDFNVPRFWSYASYASVVAVLFACSGKRVVIRMFSAILIGIGLYVGISVIKTDGRSVAYNKMRDELDRRAPGVSVVFVNHYETRWFTWNYPFSPDRMIMIPGYWEYGEIVRKQILENISANSRPFVLYIEKKEDKVLSDSVGLNTKPLVQCGDYLLEKAFGALGITQNRNSFLPYFSEVNW